MIFATHIIKIHGAINQFIWPEKKLRNYVDKKVKNDIFVTFHARLKSFRLEEEKVEVRVYLSALPSEVTAKVVDEWLKDNTIRRGLGVENFEIEIIASKIDPDFNRSKELIFLE
ncbi:MAG: hypothetical protein WC788_09795 [Candidatus Paceibacterota bacterium]|jgi:hypothetical protein